MASPVASPLEASCSLLHIYEHDVEVEALQICQQVPAPEALLASWLAACTRELSRVKQHKAENSHTSGDPSTCGSVTAVHEDVLLKCEIHRLGTFSCDFWVYDNIIDARELVRNGFIYAELWYPAKVSSCDGFVDGFDSCLFHFSDLLQERCSQFDSCLFHFSDHQHLHEVMQQSLIRLTRWRPLHHLSIIDLSCDYAPTALDSIGDLNLLEYLLNVQVDFSGCLTVALGRLSRLKVQKIDLRFCKLTSLSYSIRHLEQLEVLSLRTSNFSYELNAAIGRLCTLKKLDITSCDLCSVPESIGDLTMIVQRDGSGNCIKHLSVGLAFTRLRQLELEGNPITEPPKAIWEQGLDAIKSYLRALLPGGALMCADTINMIGETGAGKTSIAESLVARSPRPTAACDRTRVMHQLRMNVDETSGHCVYINDFGGHEIYHSVMRIFLPTNGLLIMVFDMTAEVQEQRVKTWLLTALAKTREIRVLIAGTHADKLPDGERLTLEKRMREFLSEILESAVNEVNIHLCHIESRPDKNSMQDKLKKLYELRSSLRSTVIRVVTLSCSEPDARLTRLYEVVVALLRTAVTLPVSWCRAINEMFVTNAEDIVLTMEQVKDICEKYFTNEVDDVALTTILRYLGETSQILWIEDHPQLRNFIFHSPQKIINACEEILHHDIESPSVSLLYPQQRQDYQIGILREPLLGTLPEMFEGDLRGSEERVAQPVPELFSVVIDFLQRFNLISHSHGRQFIIPCNLSPEEPSKFKKYMQIGRNCQNRVTVRLSFIGSVVPLSFFETSLASMLTVAGEFPHAHVSRWRHGLIFVNNEVYFLAKLKESYVTLTAFAMSTNATHWEVLQPMLSRLNDNAVASWHGAPPSSSVRCPWCAWHRYHSQDSGESEVGEIKVDLHFSALPSRGQCTRPTCPECVMAIPVSLCFSSSSGSLTEDQEETCKFFEYNSGTGAAPLDRDDVAQCTELVRRLTSRRLTPQLVQGLDRHSVNCMVDLLAALDGRGLITDDHRQEIEFEHHQRMHISFTGLKKALGRLKGVSLQQCKLPILPDSIGDLEQLEELVLWRNHLSDGLNPDFVRLLMLKKLDLSSCGLKSVPDWFGDLETSHSMNFDGIAAVNLYNKNFIEIPEEFLQKCEDICALDLSLNHCLNSVLRPFCILRKLVLSECALHFIPDDIGALTQLEGLNWSHTEFWKCPNSAMTLCLISSEFDLHSRELTTYADFFQNLKWVKDKDIKSLRLEIVYTNLVTLRVYGNAIKEFSVEISSQEIDEIIPAQEIYENDKIISHLRALVYGGQLNMIGDTGAGRTSVTRSAEKADRSNVLQHFREFDSSWDLSVNDFGGHEIYHSVMPIFLPSYGLLISHLNLAYDMIINPLSSGVTLSLGRLFHLKEILLSTCELNELEVVRRLQLGYLIVEVEKADLHVIYYCRKHDVWSRTLSDSVSMESSCPDNLLRECPVLPTDVSPCDSADKESEEHPKTPTAIIPFCAPIDVLKVAECGAELTTEDDVNGHLAIKSTDSLHAPHSTYIPALDCVTRLVEDVYTSPNDLLRTFVVRTGAVVFDASALSRQTFLSSNLQRLVQLAGGSYHVFQLELFRLASLINWPHLGKLSALCCSTAGFYRKATLRRTTSVDDVACFSCGCIVEKWAAGVQPMALHREKCYQHCRFVTMPHSTGNVSIGKGPVQLPISERTNEVGTAPLSVASSMASVSEKLSAFDYASSLGVRTWTPKAARALGVYTEAGLAAMTSGSQLIKVLNATSMRSDGVQNATSSSPATRDDELTKRESYRLESFADTWMYDHVVDARDLAKNGFYYAGPGDRVQCAFCQGLLRNWELGDRVDEQHAQHFTYCRFVQGHDVGNVPIAFWPLTAKQTVDVHSSDTTDATGAELGITCTLPKNPEFAIESRRLLTFATWPASHHLQPEAIAKSGFFYVGEGDTTQCFFCDGTVSNWRANVDPWVEHAQRFASCSFLLQVKGHEFVQRHRVHDMPAVGNSKQSLAVDPREVRARMDSNKVRILLRMDYPLDLIREVVQKHLASAGSDHETSEQLLDDVFRTHDEKQKASSTQDAGRRSMPDSAGPIVISSGSARGEHNPDLHCEPADITRSAMVAMAASAAATSDGSLTQYNPSLIAEKVPPVIDLPAANLQPEEENRQLKTQLTCKVCMDSLVGIVFLPCGHLVCCASCAPAMTTCPICRVSIRGTVRTIL